MPRGQRYDLHPMAGKEAAGTDKQDLGPLFHKTRKSRVDVANVTGIEDLDSQPNRDGRSSHVCDHRFDDGRVVVRVDERSNTGGWQRVLPRSRLSPALQARNPTPRVTCA